MYKVSAEDVLKIAADAPAVIRKLAAERDEAVSKLASIERRQAVEKLAHQMHEKGLELDTPEGELAERLMAWAEQGKLAEVQRAVDLTGPDMGRKIAQVHDDHRQYTSEEGGGEFVNYLLGNVGP